MSSPPTMKGRWISRSLVHEPMVEHVPVQGRAALDHHAPDPVVLDESLHQQGQVHVLVPRDDNVRARGPERGHAVGRGPGRDRDHGRRVGLEHVRVRRKGGIRGGDHADRALPLDVADGQERVVDPDRVGPDHDRVAAGPGLVEEHLRLRGHELHQPLARGPALEGQLPVGRDLGHHQHVRAGPVIWHGPLRNIRHARRRDKKGRVPVRNPCLYAGAKPRIIERPSARGPKGGRTRT